MTKPKVSLKTDGTYYIGLGEDKIFFDFISCASAGAWEYIDVYNDDGNFMGYLELIGGDYE